MNKNLKRVLAGAVGIVMMLSVFSGCGSKKETSTAEGTSTSSASASGSTGIDTSKKVELSFWMLGDPPKDMQLINDEINKMAEKDLNCTVKFNMTTWTDTDAKYQRLLASGEPVDLIFTAEWMKYQQYAKAGAFLALDDIIPKASPELWQFVPQDYWDGVKINGKIMTIPATWKEYVTDGLTYRKDLCKKYNIPEPTSLETLEQYCDTIAKNEKGMEPFGDFTGDYGFIRELLHPWLDRNMPVYGLAAMDKTPTQLYKYWGSEEHLTDLKLKKEWADKGYWSKSVLSTYNKGSFAELFYAGKIGALINNANAYGDAITNVRNKHPEWELGYFPFAKATGVTHPVHPVHNGFAVPKSSQNPERAVAFYAKMVLDKNYNLLTQYGIEGKHYEVEDGYYKMIGDSSTNGFGREAMCSWAWRNPDYMLFDKSFDPVKAIFSDLDKIATKDIFNGFAEDYSSYQAEKTALETVRQQYLWPLEAGLVPDVENGLKTFMEKAKAAGLDKIQDEYTKQWEQYCKEMNIQ